MDDDKMSIDEPESGGRPSLGGVTASGAEHQPCLGSSEGDVIASGAEDQPSLGSSEGDVQLSKKRRKDDKPGASNVEVGQGSGPNYITLGGFNVVPTEFGGIFQSCTFVDRILYCIPNDIGELDFEIIDNLYSLIMAQVRKEMKIESSEIGKLLQLPLNCLTGTIKRIMDNDNLFVISEDSRKTIDNARRAISRIFSGLQEWDNSLLVFFNEILEKFWEYRKYLESLPADNEFAEILRSIRKEMIAHFTAILDKSRRNVPDNVVCSVLFPLTSGYNIEHDNDILPLFSLVLKDIGQLINDVGPNICTVAIPADIKILQENLHKIENCSNFCTLIEDLWARFDYIFCNSDIWERMMPVTFWLSKHVNADIAHRGSATLVSVLTSLQDKDFSSLGPSYSLDLVYDVFRGFSRDQDESVFVLYVELALLSFSLAHKNKQGVDDIEKTVSRAISDSCYDVPKDERDELVSKVIACEDNDGLKKVLRSFFFGGNLLSDFLKG